MAALEALHPAHEALKLLQHIRCHPKRHDLERDWLSAADKVIGYWDDVRAVQKIEAAQNALRAVLAQPTQPQGEPYCYVYEYHSAFGLHREFSPRHWNGAGPDRSVPVYLAAPQRVAQPDDSERLRIAIREALPFTMLMGQKILVKALSAPTITAPQRVAQPLTKQEIVKLWRTPFDRKDEDSWFVEFARAVEAAHGIGAAAQIGGEK
jgi:hypothetical protein